MKIQIISVGKIDGSMSTIFNHYTKMTSWNIKNTEISYSKKFSGNQSKIYESKIIKEKITKNSFVISLDPLGKKIDSFAFSKIFQKNMINSKNVDFIIGGAFGLEKSILDISDSIISLSDMTFPHQLAKIILIEQIYRAETILNNHPYHK